MTTYGEFIDLVYQTKCIEAQLFIEQWRALATEEEWKEYRPLSLTPELVISFAEDMATYFQETIAGTCGEELYEQRKQNAHAFLREVHAKAEKLGVRVDLNQVDAPLTPSDAMATASLVKLTSDPDGQTTVTLTKKGERLAGEIEKEIKRTQD